MNKSETVPDRLSIEDKDRKIYDPLKEVNLFEKQNNKNLFLLAMVWGFHQKQSKPLKKLFGFVRESYLRDSDESLINAIAVHKKNDLNVLLDKKEVYKIAEEYANAGIKLIDEMISESDEAEFIKRMEYVLLEKYEEMDIDENG